LNNGNYCHALILSGKNTEKSYKLQAPGSKFQAASRKLQAASCKLQAIDY
jgi:division protein CdvB (Snf7/Vps24/ESCRT-III family)